MQRVTLRTHPMPDPGGNFPMTTMTTHRCPILTPFPPRRYLAAVAKAKGIDLKVNPLMVISLVVPANREGA